MEQNSNSTTSSAASNETETNGVPAAGTEATTAPKRRSRRATAAVGEVVTTPVAEPDAAPATPAHSEAATDAASDETPKQRVSRARKKAAVVPGEDGTPGAEAGQAEAPAAADKASKASTARATKSRAKNAEAAASTSEDSVENDATAPKKRTTRSKKTETTGDALENKQPEDAKAGAGQASASSEEAMSGPATDDAAGSSDGDRGNSSRRTSSRARSNTKNGAEKNEDADKSEAAKAGSDNGDSNEGDKRSGSGRNGRGNRNDRNDHSEDGQQRQTRTRQRDRKRRGQSDDHEPEITEDDVLLPIAGILDVLDNYAFVRTAGYLPGANDVYVSLGQVKKYSLRRGDSVVGAIRQPRDGEGGGRQKYNAIVRVDTINSRPVEESQARTDFTSLTPIHPTERLRIETSATDFTQRIIDLFAPVGKGQRGLIIGPRESGKSTTLRRIASAIAENQPDVHLMMVLIDERPEEVTDLQRTVNGEVVASTFDLGAEDHVTLTELAIERAKRLVELGHDVVVLVDSLTSLARSYNALSTSRVPAGNLDAAAIYPVKKLLGAARNLENGGSLTIIATASAQPGSRVDEAVIGELDAATNMQLRLSGEAADRRVYPAVDLHASSTRNEERLTSESEVKVMNHLRRTLADTENEPGLEAVLQRLSETSSNVEFLALTQRAQVAN